MKKIKNLDRIDRIKENRIEDRIENLDLLFIIYQ